VTEAYDLRTSLTIARGHLDLLRKRATDAPEITIALQELEVIEAIATSLLRRTGEEFDHLSPASEPLALPLRGSGLAHRVRSRIAGRSGGGRIKRRWRSSKVLLGALLSVGIIASAATAANRQIALKAGPAYPVARGSAQYQAQPGQRELQLEVEHIRLLAGKRVLVYVNGARVGSAPVSRRGVAELNRNTERGQRVPHIRSEAAVRVRTANGALIVSGTF
jgi:hypothetical protein